MKKADGNLTVANALKAYQVTKQILTADITRMDNYPYYWRIKARLPERKVRRRRMLARGAMNSCLLEFEDDGYKVITSRNYIRKGRLPSSDLPKVGEVGG